MNKNMLQKLKNWLVRLWFGPIRVAVFQNYTDFPRRWINNPAFRLEAKLVHVVNYRSRYIHLADGYKQLKNWQLYFIKICAAYPCIDLVSEVKKIGSFAHGFTHTSRTPIASLGEPFSGTFLHYKGGRYMVEGEYAYHEASGQSQVMYRTSLGALWVRDIDDFYSSVRLSIGQYVMRFEPLEAVANEMIKQAIREANKALHSVFVKEIDTNALRLIDNLHADAIGTSSLYL